MSILLNSINHGFELIEVKRINEMDSLARSFIHKKSGAKLFHLENNDDNKVFSITFRTPPIDNTGLPHILEHSVFCGSRKYPSKDPFIELVKGSQNTFINAMTFSDKTMYPIASRNEKDFMNLMDVYMDAVFYPNIYNCPQIFMQEGWHYEAINKDSDITYEGIVYNEMKGAFSSPELTLTRNIYQSLFPETSYRFTSGGDPDYITDLKEEKLLEYHKRYYHPSNCYIYIYGNGDILQYLKHINDEYLTNFEMSVVDSGILEQKSFTELKEVASKYPISEKESDENKTYLSLSYVIGRSTDAEAYIAMEILEHFLISTSGAPLKKAILEAELGSDVIGKYDNSTFQPVLSIVVKNSDPSKKEKLKDIVNNTLKDLIKEGIDKRLIEASINMKEFQLREANYEGYPIGLVYNRRLLDSWLYGGNPTIHLEYTQTLARIRNALETDYFEKLISRYLLKNTHCALLIHRPEKGLVESKQKALDQKLKSYRAGLSEGQLESLVNQNNRLKERQNTPDTAESLNAIPILSIEDIKLETEELPLIELWEQNVKVLKHSTFTNNISYVNLLFDTRAIPQELLPYIALLSDVLGKVNTENYDYDEISREINLHTGELKICVEVYEGANDDGTYYPKLAVKSKVLAEKLPKLFQLLAEIIGSSKFEDTKRLKEILKSIKSRLEMKINRQTLLMSCKRLFSYFSVEGSYSEILSGLSYYKFVSNIVKNIDDSMSEIQMGLSNAARLIFNTKNLLVSLTCDEASYERFRSSLPVLLVSLYNEKITYYNIALI